MPVPAFQSLMLPVLRIAGSGEFQTRRSLDRLADEFRLSLEERGQTLRSGGTRFANRVHWAVVYLQRANLISRRSRGVYEITELGRKILANPPPKFDLQFVYQFDGVRDFRQGRPQEPSENPSTLTPAVSEASEERSSTPEERIETALLEHNGALRAELLDRILAMTPTGFERLIVDLMLGMGYGADGSATHLGKTADGGIDGVINEDVLGLDVIYLQAKRYAPDNGIGVEKIREFAGALDERGATKGVFVTTSYFAGPAKQYSERSHKRLVLIDGQTLADHMVRFSVAVRTFQKHELKKLDTDYFDELDV